MGMLLKDKITSANLIKIFEKIANDVIESRDVIRELDAAIGDGDLGVTTSSGFKSLRNGLVELSDSDIGTILIKCGINYNKSGASTFGTLLSIALIKAGNEVKGKNDVDLLDLVKMANAAVQEIKSRGKAQIGDKTMLDVLSPATEALQSAYNHKSNMKEALDKAINAGEEGLKSTIHMRSKVGRSSWLGDKTIGKQDPGATVIYLMLKSFIEFVKSS
jgi:dihydroxyacetone kinase-like protein